MKMVITCILALTAILTLELNQGNTWLTKRLTHMSAVTGAFAGIELKCQQSAESEFLFISDKDITCYRSAASSGSVNGNEKRSNGYLIKQNCGGYSLLVAPGEADT
jgi:hypothetical protein